MDISTLIDDFRRQKVQSEAEVRSKLIVPLLELLGYPKDFRAEEFPIYGYEGSKALPSKAADFLQFTSNEFDVHRGKSDKEIEWVYQHSLLIFEAKKPTEEILVKGQPVFYSAWTKSVAYMISNGIKIEGYVVNANYSDTRVFSCKVEEIPEKWEELNKLNYDCVLKMKDIAAESGEWICNDIYENYKNSMRVRCNEELCACVDRNLEEFEYELNIVKRGNKKVFSDVLNERCKIITSEPGGGKSYFMRMLMREYLVKYNVNNEKIPVILEGRYFGKVYHSIIDGIYEELKILIPSLTKEQIEKRLEQGGFVVLFDALDEVEFDYDSLIYQLSKLRRETNNTLIVTSRIQNYKGDFCTDFEHYSLERLDDEKVLQLLKKYSNGEMEINIHHIPKRLLEVIRTPLFLKMFVTISKRERMHKIPSNHAALFEQYIAEKMRVLSCTLYEETLIKSVLGKYALYSYEKSDCTEKFFETLEKTCTAQNKEKIYNIIWKTGLIANGLQGVKYCHKTVHEFFVALYVSTYEEDELYKWLDENVLKEAYIEVICYLTGIISNKEKQNYILDYLEKHNLPLFTKALESRRNFEVMEQNLNMEYVKSYYTQILKTYDTIIQTHLKNIANAFDGYDKSGRGKLCIRGDMSFDSTSISMVIYNGLPEAEEIDVKLSSGSGAKLVSSDGKEVPIRSSVWTMGEIHQRSYNLELLSYGFDSSREIAVDIIKKQIEDAMDKKILFDVDIDVLLVERVEKALKKWRRKLRGNSLSPRLSLYTNTVSEIIDNMKNIGIYSQETALISSLCKVLEVKAIKVNNFLDIKGDLELGEGRRSYRFDELYSDEMLVKKAFRIVDLAQKAIQTIVKEIIPVLTSVEPNSQMIGIIYRNDNDSGIEYIMVRKEEGKECSPIIEFREERVDTYPNYDVYFINHLQEIKKSQDDIISSGSAALWCCFEDEIFHNIIYKHIKNMFEKVLGKF